MISPKKFKPNLEPKRWARNGMLPNAGFIGGANGVVGRQNHIMSYRRKCFMNVGDFDNPPQGLTGSTVLYRAYCHTGHGATHIGFRVGLGLDLKSSGVDPRIEIKVTLSGGATTTETVRYGFSAGPSLDSPSAIGWFSPRVAVTANARYEISITAVDYARPISVLAYEIAATDVDSAIDYFYDHAPGVGYPVLSSLRSRALIGLSQMWRHNGSHLLTYPGSLDGVSPTYASTTWTNVLDGSTAITAATPGYSFGGGDSESNLSQHCRQSDGQVLDVVFAVHGSMSAGSTGEVRLQDSTGTRCSITGIGVTSQWYTTTTTISAVDTMAKVDLQARTSNAANTLTVNAVCLFSYLA